MSCVRGLVACVVCVAGVLVCEGSVEAKPKVLYVDSYHQGYLWSDGITAGIQSALGYKLDDKWQVVDESQSVAELKIFRMDTKLFTGLVKPEGATMEQIKALEDEFKKAKALEVKAEIESWKPDVVIASDDNAAKYVIAAHYKDAALPFVFCGLNWDASVYGFPCSNVTGMVEVALVPEMLAALKPFTKGDRIGFLGGNTETDQKEATNIQKNFNLTMNVVMAEDLEAWKQGFLKLQDEVDVIVLNTMSGVKGLNYPQASAFALEHTKVPAGGIQEEETRVGLMAYAKVPQEQGEWAAQAALKILNGTSPKDIPVEKNKRGQICLNRAIADKLAVKFPLAMIKQAKIYKPEDLVAMAMK